MDSLKQSEKILSYWSFWVGHYTYAYPNICSQVQKGLFFFNSKSPLIVVNCCAFIFRHFYFFDNVKSYCFCEKGICLCGSFFFPPKITSCLHFKGSVLHVSWDQTVTISLMESAEQSSRQAAERRWINDLLIYRSGSLHGWRQNQIHFRGNTTLSCCQHCRAYQLLWTSLTHTHTYGLNRWSPSCTRNVQIHKTAVDALSTRPISAKVWGQQGTRVDIVVNVSAVHPNKKKRGEGG